MVMDSTGISGFFGMEDDAQTAPSSAPTLLNPSAGGPFVLYKWLKSGRYVVLKTLDEEHKGDIVCEEMLRKEYEIGRSLNHPNIREYYDLCEVPGIGLAIEMEWVDGSPLSDYVQLCRKDDALCDKIVSQLLDAVRFIHLKQVVHRDLKPANILITNNGNNLKLIDFSLSDSDSHQVLKGNAGTAMYASPEQLSCQKSDYRSDIYSLGVILSELSGRRTYRRVARKCMARAVEKRYRSVDEIDKALFHPLPPGPIFYAAVVIVLVLGMVWFARIYSAHKRVQEPEPEEYYLDGDSIDKIFIQATDAIEETIPSPED